MARSQSYLAKCDRHGCKTVIEIEGNTLAPEGWLRVDPEVNGKWDSNTAKEFCSAKCVSLWAKDRSKNQIEERANGNGRNVIDHIRDAITILSEEKGEFKSFEIQSLSGITQTTVDRHLKGFVEDGIIEVTDEGNRTPSKPRLYRVRG